MEPLQLITKSSASEHNAKTFAKYEFKDACLTIYGPCLEHYGILYSCIIYAVLFHAKDTMDLEEPSARLSKVQARLHFRPTHVS